MLCGGKGERLDPLTRDMPKAIIPFQGRPLLEQSVYSYWKYGIWELWLSVGHKASEVTDKYVYPSLFEPYPIGTGGWLSMLKKDKDLMEHFKQDDFYVNNADNLLNVDLKEMMEFHKRNKNIVTIACVMVDDVRDGGSINIKDNKITKFKEKIQSPKPKKGYINAGFYIFSPEIFNYVPDLVFEDVPGQGTIAKSTSLEKDIFPRIVKTNKVGGFIVNFKDGNRQWFDTGTFERYKEASNKWLGV